MLHTEVRIRRIVSSFIAVVFALILTSCGQQRTTWEEQYDLGVRYLSEGNYEEAILAFTAAIEIDPKRTEAYLGRADAYIGSGETAENLVAARADYETVLTLDESCTEAWLGIADVCVRQGDYDGAMKTLREALDKVGENSDIENKLLELESTGDAERGKYHDLYREYFESYSWVDWGNYDTGEAEHIGTEGVCDYYFYDVDKDGVDELLIVAGTAIANGNCLIFAGEGAAVKNLAVFSCSSLITLFGRPVQTGFIMVEVHTGIEWAGLYDFDGGRLTQMDSDQVDIDSGRSPRFPADENYALEPAGSGHRTVAPKPANGKNCYIVAMTDTAAASADFTVDSENVAVSGYQNCVYGVFDKNAGMLASFAVPIAPYYIETGVFHTADDATLLLQTDRYFVFEIFTGPGEFYVLSYDVERNTFTQLPSLVYSEYRRYLIGIPLTYDTDSKWWFIQEVELQIRNADGSLVKTLVGEKYGTCFTCLDHYVYYSFSDTTYIPEDGHVSAEDRFDDIEQQIWRFDLNTQKSEFVSTVYAGYITEIGTDYVISYNFNDWESANTIYY